MIDHFSLPVSDIALSSVFYDAVLAPLGYRRLMAMGEPTPQAIAYGPEMPLMHFWIVAAPPGEQSKSPAGMHIAFHATDHAAVRNFHEAGLAAGGTDNGPPGPRPQYSEDYYAAFLLDPDGHHIEAVSYFSGDD